MWGGYFFYGIETQGASIVLEEHSDLYADVFFKFMANCLCFAIVYLTIAFVFESTSRDYVRQEKISLSAIVRTKHVLIFSFAAVVFYAIGNGVEGVFWRTEYMQTEVHLLKIAGTAMCLAAAFALGLKILPEVHQRKHILTALLLILLVNLAYSSRVFPVGVLLFGVGVAASDGNRIAKVAILLGSIFVFPFLIHMVLVLRDQPVQGLIPFFSGLLNGNSAIFDDYNLMISLNNIILSNFAIAAITAISGAFDFNYFMTSLSPLPGFMTDWYSLETDINPSTPYASMGELVGYSMFFSLIFYMLLACVFFVIEYKSKNNLYYFVVGRAFLAMFIVTSMQYQVRTSSRYIYYFVFISFLVFAFKKLINSERNNG